jgi:hypothetical protein
VAWRAIESAEFAVSYADICIVKDNVVDESDSVTKETSPQHIRYKAHGINIVRFDQPNALFKPKSATCKGTVENITNIGFTQKIRNQFIIIMMQMLTGFL